MNTELRFYLSVFLRRLPIFLFVFMSIASVGIATSLILPSRYTSDGSLLVESPQIPDDMARTTVAIGAREQLSIVQRRILTRSNLLEIARQNDVYEDLVSMTPDEIVRRMREDTGFRLSGDNSNNATVLSVSFTARRPDIAARVANEFITRILEDNVEQRRALAQETLSFFEQEVERLETELDLKNQAILEFQTANQDSLPSTLDYRISRQANLQSRLANLARDELVLEQQRRALQDALENQETDQTLSQAEQQLVQLRGELTSALAVYTETSPRVQTLRARVAALEGQVESELGARANADEEQSDQDGASTAAQRRAERQLEEVDIQLDFIEAQQARIEAELDQLAVTISRTPTNALTLGALERELDSVRQQHAQAVSNLAQAATGERIEVMSKGQRVSILEQALPPSEPSSPNRRFIAAAGVAAGLGSAFGLVLILELLNKSVRRPEDLTGALGITPLVTIPYIATPWETARKRIAIGLVFVVILAGIPAALYYVHYQVMPLDLLMDRAITRILP